MTLKASCNDAALPHATTANQFGSISESRQCAIAQIKQHYLGIKPHYKVLDLGVNDGAFLQALKPHMPLAEFTGIDVSKQKLNDAQKTVSFIAIEACATEASRFLPLHSQDLVLAHFINAYIPIHTLFNEAKRLTRSNGHFSLITTTYDSFPHAQQQLAQFIAKDNVLSRIVGHYYKTIVKNATVAAGEEELLNTFSDYQFQIEEHYRLKIPIELNNIDELASFGIEGTWFLNNLSMRMLPKHFLVQRLKRLFTKIFTFPHYDTHIIDIMLAKK